MTVVYTRVVTTLLFLGFIHLLPARSAAQDVDSKPITTSPTLCAGLFQGSLTLPDEAGSPDALSPLSPLSNDVLARGLAIQAAAPKPDQPARTSRRFRGASRPT
jgi:hypothetical protein